MRNANYDHTRGNSPGNPTVGVPVLSGVHAPPTSDIIPRTAVAVPRQCHSDDWGVIMHAGKVSVVD